jgi:hypothetical protein
MAIASKYWTLAELTTKIERDLDLEGEIFIQPEELTGYINEAIDEAESEVHGLYEDYFLTKAAITLVSGTSEYSLPSSIYAHKIRRVTYRNGTKTYPVQRVRDWRKFERYEWQKVYGAQSEAEYQYFLLNSTAGAPTILFIPEVSESGAYITVWFLRQANFLVADADKMDIPEAANFVMQHAKVRCYEKEGHPNLPKAMADLERERALLQGILASMIPDADNEIEADTSFYEEFN